MADRINLNYFKNRNLPPIKDVAKTTAALTLLLSTAACNSNGVSTYIEKNICWVGPLLFYGGAYAVLTTFQLIENRHR